MRRTRRRSRSRGLLLIVLSSALLFELVLQLGAVGTWLTHERALAAGDGAILCVGDSFTFGLGAEKLEESYPNELMRLLAADGGPGPRVVNAAWPGRHSVEVCAELDRQLRAGRPRVVCVLAGINDTWAKPGRVEEMAGDGPAGFRFELRTVRLCKLLLGGLQDGPAESRPAAAGPAGCWRCGEVVLDLRDAGRALLCGQEWTWRTVADQLILSGPGGASVAARWRLEQDRLAITLPGTAVPLWFERTWAGTGERLDESGTESVAAALQRAQVPPATAAAAARARVAANAEDAAARLQLLTALFQLGQLDQASEQADLLADQFARTQDRAAGEALLAGLLTLKRREPAIAAARDLVARHPTSLQTWVALAEESLDAGDRAQAGTAAEQALGLLPKTPSAMRARLLRFRAAILRSTDPVAATRSLLQAYLEDGDGRFLVESLKVGHVQTAPAEFEAALQAVTRDPAAERRLRALWSQATGREAGILEDLRCNLRAMVARAHVAGARVVLLGYPFARPDLEQVQRDVAEETGAVFVPTWPAFTEELRTRARSELYIPDGHCNSAGYALMARLLLPAVRKLL